MSSVLRVCAIMFGFFCLSTMTGCATILGGGGQEPVLISSDVPGRHVEVVNRKGVVVHNGNTPFTVTLKRGDGYFTPAKYTLRTDGAPASAAPISASVGQPRPGTQLNAGFNGWYVGNVIFGGLIGLVLVDPISGAMWDLPNEFNVDYQNGKKPKESQQTKPKSLIIITQEPQPPKLNTAGPAPASGRD